MHGRLGVFSFGSSQQDAGEQVLDRLAGREAPGGGDRPHQGGVGQEAGMRKAFVEELNEVLAV